jgi:hypothetical protein
MLPVFGQVVVVDLPLLETTSRYQRRLREEAMKYLCLIYEDESVWQTMAKAELDKAYAEYTAFKEDIERSGHLLGCNPLQPTRSAITVRVRNGKVSTTDGPFAETKEQLGGYFLIEAMDLDEATRIAARIPGARVGSIEVRPIMEF